MNYLQFDKNELINLEYSLSKEILRTNRAGSYASLTLVGCNTRKYHGLLVCPMEHLDGGKHVLLSSLDLSIIHDANEFNLGIHKYQGDLYLPRGHKYVQDFNTENNPQIYYRVGSVRILRENVLVEKEQQFLTKYTILESERKIKLKFTPFLAFRNIHALSKANMDVNTKVKFIKNGIKTKMYEGYPYLNIQFSKEVEFIQFPDWYYNVEYPEDQKSGYDFKEDLFVPGFFETYAKKGDSIIFSASTEEVNPDGLKQRFVSEIKKRVPRNNFKNCLINSAEQFIVRKGKGVEIIAGYHWFSPRGRDTFISLPGLTLTHGDTKSFLAAVKTMISKMKDGQFPSHWNDKQLIFDAADVSLWFIWALQQYSIATKSYKPAWTTYGNVIKSVLQSYINGASQNAFMLDNGLLFAGQPGKALTWMDAIVDGKPVTPREGCAVEINALWYNAICFALELASKSGDSAFIKKWSKLPQKISASFCDNFWDSSYGYLADVVNGENKDWTVRPNQVIAASVKYSPINPEMKNSLIETVKRYLLTGRGLRSLAPKHPDYTGIYQGNQVQRDLAYHQGTVWPWLLEHYCEAYLQLYKKSGVEHIRSILKNFESVISEHGIGSVSEIYDGDPPHTARGAISQAWSVASLLRIINKIEKFESTE